MSEKTKTGLETLLKNNLVAIPANLVKLELAKELGWELTAAVVNINGYLVDAYVFSLTDNLLAQVLQAGSMNEVATGIKKMNYVQCVWEAKLLPLFVADEGNVIVEYDSEQSDQSDEEDKSNEEAARDRVVLLKYAEILRRFSQITGGVKFHLHRKDGSTKAPFAPEPGVVHIFFNMAPPGESQARYLNKAFGLMLDREGMAVLAAGPTIGRGKIFSDKKEPLVQIVGNNIYLLLPTFSYYLETRSTQLFEKAITLAWNGYRENVGKQENDEPADEMNFVEVMNKFEEKWHKRISDKIAEVDNEIDRLRTELLNKYKDRRDFVRWASYLASQQGQTKETLAAEYQKIKAEENVVGIYLVGKGIHVKTKPLYLEYEAKIYAVGSFVIRIGEQGDISVWNEQPLHPAGVPHPHIAKDGGPCFGNATDAITKATASRKYADAIRYVLRWLTQGYSPELAEVKIEEWPEVCHE